MFHRVPRCHFWLLFALVPAQLFSLLKVKIPNSGQHAQLGTGLRGLLTMGGRVQMTVEMDLKS